MSVALGWDCYDKSVGFPHQKFKAGFAKIVVLNLETLNETSRSTAVSLVPRNATAP
jgi:hypothetical protein